MCPPIIGLFSAMPFGLSAYWVYGLDALVSFPGIGAVFWAAIGAGALVSAASALPNGALCRLAKPVPALPAKESEAKAGSPG